jgi:recombination protein RecA
LDKTEKFKMLDKLSAILDEEHTDEKSGRIVKNSLIRLNAKKIIRIPSISTDLPTFDYDVLQFGGIPRGRIVEIFGPESSGKTTTSLWIIGRAQKVGDIAAFIDVEHKLDPNYAATLGVNLDELILNQPNSGEEALQTVDKLVDSGCVNLIVVDSAAALVPEAELAGEIGDAHVGLQARMMSQAMRILIGKCARNQVTILFINQIREKIGVMWGNPETTPCGRALKFYSSLRLSITRKEPIWEGTKENIVGHTIDLRCVKNGGGIPFRRTEIGLIYPGQGRKAGFDVVSDTIAFADNRNLFQKSGSWYFLDLGNKDAKGKPLGAERVANGLDKFKAFLRGDAKAMVAALETIMAYIKKETEVT